MEAGAGVENSRFDSLVKSLAVGSNRRSVLKGILGLGGAAVVGETLLEPGADAARRPTPTPKPVSCPGSQHWDGARCACTTGETCGAECCHIGSECCDGACCWGHCYEEELCCSYDNWCEATGECCPDGATCCGEQGCVVIEEGACGCDGLCPEGFECCGGQCCSSGYCAGGVCCAFGVCGDTCREDPLQVCCGGVPYIPETHYCCDGTVVEGECCASSGCGSELECCGSECCVIGSCIGGVCCRFGVCGDSCLSNHDDQCCGGAVYDPRQADCCGDALYDRRESYCCDGVVVEGDCCASGGCEEGFECCGGVCCADGYCASGLCCATPACAGSCIGDPNLGCCAGQTYDMSDYVCCGDQIIAGNCCVDGDCGTCVRCEAHICGEPRC